MYSIDEIKKFITVLEESSLAVLELQKEDGSKIRLEKPQTDRQFITAPSPVRTQPNTTAESERTTDIPSEADAGKTVKSPIVGVFYAAPSPDAQPYVSVGSKIKKGDVVCIVEAMKCMNEIQAEEDGEITEILVDNGDLVEYGQPLFKII